MRSSAFGDILRLAVDRTPQAIGGSFAASDGEMVDYVAGIDATEWAILTAHYGIVLAHVASALSTWHFGGAELAIFGNSDIDVLVRPVGVGYFVLLAVRTPTPLGAAMDALEEAAIGLRREMRL